MHARCAIVCDAVFFVGVACFVFALCMFVFFSRAQLNAQCLTLPWTKQTLPMPSRGEWFGTGWQERNTRHWMVLSLAHNSCGLRCPIQFGTIKVMHTRFACVGTCASRGLSLCSLKWRARLVRAFIRVFRLKRQQQQTPTEKKTTHKQTRSTIAERFKWME